MREETTPLQPPQPTFPPSPRRDSQLRNRRSSSISINSTSRYTAAADPTTITQTASSRRNSNGSRNNSVSLSTSVFRTPSLDWNWPTGVAGAGASAGAGAGIIHYPPPVAEYTEEPEEFEHDNDDEDDAVGIGGLPTPPATSSFLNRPTKRSEPAGPRAANTTSRHHIVPVKSRSRDSHKQQRYQSQDAQKQDVRDPSWKRSTRKHQQQPQQHTSYRSQNQQNRNHVSSSRNNSNYKANSMLPPQSTYNLSDSQDGGRDGGRAGGGGGGGGSSSGFLTSDNDNEHENEYTDEPLSLHDDDHESRSRHRNTLGGAAEKTGRGKYSTTTTMAAAADDGYEREYEEEDEGLRSGGSAAEMSSFVQSQQAQAAQSSSSTTTTTSGRVKRPTRKSSSKALFPSSSALHSASATNIMSTRNQQQSSSTHATNGQKKGNLKQNLAIAFLVILGLFLLGTVIVLSTIKRYFAIPDWAYLSEAEIGGWPSSPGGQVQGLIPSLVELNSSMPVAGGGGTTYDDGEDGEEGGSVWGPNGEGTGGYWMRRDWQGQVADTESWERLYNVSTRPGERIPRIIHQTWKSDVLPEKWRKIWMECREGMPDYEYMLWTDDQSRHFIAAHYPQFLAMFDGYEYPIQRADAIRYFVLHHFGGIYMDLDIGCRRRLEPLISGDWDVLLPRTKPVGVSNDLIFSAKRHPFMEATIHGLVAFDHRYVTNYPTVMFSTGPMFLSAQYGIYTSAHPLTPTHPRPQIRILPKSLYGKNAKEGEAPHSFFAHYYGSSWHSDDAGFITFLGSSGKLVMYLGMVVFVLGGLRYFFARGRGGRGGKGVRSGKRGLRRLIVGDLTTGGGSSDGGGAYHMVSLLPTSATASRTVSPVHSRHASGSDDDETTTSNEGMEDGHTAHAIMNAVRRAGHFILAAPATLLTSSTSSRSTMGDHTNRSGVLYFLPAFFAPVDATGETTTSSGGARPGRRARTASMASMLPSSRTTRTAVGGGRRSRQSSYAQSRLESGNYHQQQQQYYHHPAPQSLSHGVMREEDERYLSPSEDAKRFPSAPPPYETSPAEEDPMHEVDVFLKSQE